MISSVQKMKKSIYLSNLKFSETFFSFEKL